MEYCCFCGKKKKSDIGRYCSSSCWNKDNRDRCVIGEINYRKRTTKSVLNEMTKKWRKGKGKEKYSIARLRAKKKAKLKDPIKALAQKSDWRKREDKCSKCGSKDRLEFHHTDYIKRVGVTLCSDCHRETHRRGLL